MWRLLLAAWLVSLAVGARAAVPSSPKVVVIADELDPTAARMGEELALIGFRVVRVTGDDEGDLAVLARAHGAVAAARVEPWPPEVVLFVDPAASSQQDLPSTLKVSDSLTGNIEHELLALRAVELLRGRLLVLPPRPPPATPATKPAVTRRDASGVRTTPDAAPSRRERLGSIAAGPAIGASPGGVPVAPLIALTGRYLTVWRLGIEAHVLAPTTAATLHEPEGAVDLRSLAMGGGITLLVTEPGEGLLVMAGVGLDAVGLIYRAEAVPPLSSSEGISWSAAPYGALGIGYRFLPWFALRGDVQVDVLLPEPIVRVAARESASFGRPLVMIALGAEFWP